MFCAVTQRTVHGPFFFEEPSITGQTYLEMITNWLVPRLAAEGGDYIFQQDGAPQHWSLPVRTYLNAILPNRWIGRGGQHDLLVCKWPPRSPDLTVYDFFLWGYIKDKVYVPPLPATVDDLQERITAAVHAITPEMMQRVWIELAIVLMFADQQTEQTLSIYDTNQRHMKIYYFILL